MGFRHASVAGVIALVLSAAALLLIALRHFGVAAVPAAWPLLALGLALAASLLLSLGVYALGTRYSPFLRRSEAAAMAAYTLLSAVLAYGVVTADYRPLGLAVAAFGMTAFLVGIGIARIEALGPFGRATGVVHAAAGLLFLGIITAPLGLVLFGISTLMTSRILWLQAGQG